MKIITIPMLLGMCLFFSCSKEETTEIPEFKEDIFNKNVLVRNLAAVNYNKPTYFNFRKNKIVEKPEGNNWDLGFKRHQLLINGGADTDPIERTGKAEGMIVDENYETIINVPAPLNLVGDEGNEKYAFGYARGTESWYEIINAAIFKPYKNRSFFMTTADGQYYVKFRILSGYKDIYEGFDSLSWETMRWPDYFTFEYQIINKQDKFTP
ncbi:HmuY family protein [Aquimarina hainanensis]|uniref:HmuY family protein n=1 Tax=Aquimarina hainanensis TaxID=1578017 RepID=A0ABW5N8W1_9FLAO